MLTLDQKKKLFVELHNAIRGNRDEEIIELLKDVNSEDQVWILTRKSNLGTLPFLACVLSLDKTFLALVENLQPSDYVKVFKVIEDGNTPLSEALFWGRTLRIKTLLTQVNKETFNELLNTEDCEGLSLKLLLSQKESESNNENLLADIEKSRAEKLFSPSAAMDRIGLYASIEHNKEQSDVISTNYHTPS